MALEKITVKIELLNGRWLVNNKKLDELNQVERQFLENFFTELKQKDNQLLKV